LVIGEHIRGSGSEAFSATSDAKRSRGGGGRRLERRPESGSVFAEIGDARGRYPSPDALAAAAGVCPVTVESGKHRAVGFRYIADLKLRRALTDFADDSRHANPWAADIYT
jgi:transposase